MPTYNSARFLPVSMRSVLEQSYPNLELLVADDASTDQTPVLARRVARRDPRVRFLPSSINQGAGVTRNRALAEAAGQFVAFLDADDIWEPDKLARQLAFMEEMGSAFSFTAYEICDEAGLSMNKVIDLSCPPIVGYQEMLQKKPQWVVQQ
jgi:teichuronic acid biosynthesis glycosyltransferase TuaG